MKKTNFLCPIVLSFALLCGFLGSAQRSKLSLGASPVALTDGFGVSAHVNIHHKMHDFLQAHVLFAFSTKEVTASGVEYPNDNYLLNLGYFTTAFSTPNKGLNLFIGGGASLGYEQVNGGSTELSNGSLLLDESGFVYGGFVSLNFDLFLNESLSIDLPLNAYYHPSSSIDQTMFTLGLGLRYYIN